MHTEDSSSDNEDASDDRIIEQNPVPKYQEDLHRNYDIYLRTFGQLFLSGELANLRQGSQHLVKHFGHFARRIMRRASPKSLKLAACPLLWASGVVISLA